MNQILYTGETKKKEVILNKEGMVLISALLIIIVGIVISLNIASLSNTSKALSQDEILIGNLPSNNATENNTEIENSIDTINVVIGDSTQQNNIIVQNITKKEKKQNNQTVTQKANTSSKKGYSTIAYLNIPSLNIQYPVLSKTSPELLKISLNKYWGANPNEVGNMCIVGHNYNDSRFFGKLNKIKKGAEIKITDMNGKTLSYKVYHTQMVDPYDTQCTSQLTNGNIEITLITCNYDGSQRFVVKARVE